MSPDNDRQVRNTQSYFLSIILVLFRSSRSIFSSTPSPGPANGISGPVYALIEVSCGSRTASFLQSDMQQFLYEQMTSPDSLIQGAVISQDVTQYKVLHFCVFFHIAQSSPFLTDNRAYGEFERQCLCA
jgi:hypothetical protein